MCRCATLPTFPTAASPSRTSLTLLLGFDAAAVESAMVVEVDDLLDRWKLVEDVPQFGEL